MFLHSSAAALAISYFASTVLAQEKAQTCPYKPAWNPCQNSANTAYAGLECATILVTKSYVKPAGDDNEMELNLIRYPATVNKDTAESIIVNFGGPGESGVEGLAEQGKGLSDQVSGKLHIVSFDPRGVGLNTPYNCAGNADVPDSNDFNAQSTVDGYYKAYSDKAIQCNKDIGSYGMQIGTYAVAKDVRQIAKVVGYNDQLIRYWGFSYGTVLGDTIARLFPDDIGGMVLDGNINPNDYWFQFPVEEAANIDAGIKHWFELCSAAKAECAWNDDGVSTAAQLQKKFDDWVGATADARGTTSTLNVDDSYYARNVMNAGIKYSSTYDKAATVLQGWYLKQYKPEYVADLGKYVYPPAATSNTPNDKREASSNANGNYDPQETRAAGNYELIAITGADNQFRPGNLNGATYKEWLDQYNEKSNYAGDLAIDNLWKYAPWVPKAEEYFDTEFKDIVTEPRPILFIQTPYDPVTPSDSGKAAHEAFTNSRLLTTQGVGHCSGQSTSDTLIADVNKYWTSTFIPDSGEYALNADFNPFVSSDGDNQQIESNENELDGGKRKRDLSYLFRDAVILNKRADDADTLTCDGDDTTTTTTATTSTSTMTTSTNTTTITTATTTGMYTNETTTTSSGSTTTGSTTTSMTTERYNDGTTTRPTSTSSSTSSTTTGSTTTGSTSTGSTTGSTTTSSTTRLPNNGTTTRTMTSTGSSYTTVSTTTTTTTYYGQINKSTSSYDPSGWAQWSTVTTKRTTTDPKESATWSEWSNKSTGPSKWNTWYGSDPATSMTKSTSTPKSTTTPASATISTWQSWDGESARITKYVYTIVDVCPTGLITSTITTTATCDQSKGCGNRPALPTGYQTTEVYCSACATPSKVTVTVKVIETATWSDWSSGSGVKPSSSIPGSASNADPSSARAADASSWTVWTDGNGSAARPTGSGSDTGAGTGPGSAAAASSPVQAAGTDIGDWNNWGSATGSSPVAKYTGGANTNAVVGGGLYIAVAALALVL